MSADQTVRAYLVEQLALPAEWHVIPEQRFPESIAKTTVVLQHVRIEPLSEAPIGHLRHEVVLSVIDPRTDIAAAEDTLDDTVTQILIRVDGLERVGWTSAEKVLHSDRPAWNLSLFVITESAAPDPEPTP
ncbi:hypothetical protein MRBLWH7_000798 [Microbacterium sp. LWH7-1.2]|uniref:hypothetical protein n=1 Tax=Microbacterium sp. LWH7-1.2 TaxID=3135257 RepID=UPI00313A2739